ncbi:hypothetical protein [Singulisphaera sp. PoT]|uniref:hypothetical protein n=1 Tax=Singulisphaera sp. PoT TaxID=3411797 RepID=UPI003BF56284
MTRLAEEFQRDVDPERLRRFASSLGISPSGLQRLGVGWAEEYDAWTFPMVGSDDRVIGVRLRLSGGRKISIRGGHEGIFVPADLHGSEPLLIAEGASDTCALLDLGFETIGRPSCRGGTRIVLEFVRRRRPSQVAIMADGDAPGLEGAKALAGRLMVSCPRVVIVTPPEGIKDVRAWKMAGATRESVLTNIRASAETKMRITTELLPLPMRNRGGHVRRTFR